MALKSSFSVAEVVQFAGFRTSHMVDYLCKQGLLVPNEGRVAVRGSRRYFSFRMLILARIYREMLENGAKVKDIKMAVEASSDLANAKFRENGILSGAKLAKYFVNNGRRIYLKRDGESLLEMNASGQYAFNFILDVQRLHNSVVERARKGLEKKVRIG